METLPSHSGLYKKDILGNRPPNPRYKPKDWNISCGMNYTSKFTLQFKLGCFCVYCMRVCATGPQFKLECLCVYCVCVCVCHRSPVQVGVFVCVLCYMCAVQIAALRSTQDIATTTWSISEFYITWTTAKPRPLSAVSPMVRKVRTRLLTPLL